MMMSPATTEIDRLIEQGLSCYGEGDLDGALLLWERVLVMDPDNAQANSYVDYVRMNYQLLTSNATTEHSGPFGIGDDEPEYQIEILPGEDVDPASVPPLFMDIHDEGWMIGDEGGSGSRRTVDSPMLELEAEEPPIGGVPGTFESPQTGETLSFEDATREYLGGAARPTLSFEDTTREYHGAAGGSANAPPGERSVPPASAEFVSEVTPAFGSPEDVHTPQGFGSQTTDVRRRDLGFVQPTEAEPDVAPGSPEFEMTLRTPGSQVIPVPPALADRHPEPTVDDELEDEDDAADDDDLAFELEAPTLGFGAGAAYAALDLDLEPGSDGRATLDLVGRADTRPAVSGAASDAASLIASLPSPRALGSPTKPLPARTRLPGPDVQLPSEPTTRELPLQADMPPELGVAMAPTKELPYAMQLDLLAGHSEPQPGGETPRDFADRPTNEYASRMRAPVEPIDAGPPHSKDRAPPGSIDAGPPRSKDRHHPAGGGPPAGNPSEGGPLVGNAPVGEGPPAGNPPGKPDPLAGIVQPLAPLISAPTRELGLRTARRPATEDETTGPFEFHHHQRAMLHGKVTPDVAMDPIDARSAEILEDIDRDAPANETREDRTRRRITALLERATAWGRASDLERSVVAVDLALSEDPNSALTQRLIQRNRETIMNAFQGFLGDLQRTPVLTRPLHELGSAPISPRAAFLLSRVDGTLSLDEILDVCGMPRLEAYRYLCQLFLRGILR